MWLRTSHFTVLRWICALLDTTAASFTLGLNPTMMKKKKMPKVSNPNHVSINNNKIQLCIKLTLAVGGVGNSTSVAGCFLLGQVLLLWPNILQ
jgi:hypothetical protein